jgi:hypothetical protein
MILGSTETHGGILPVRQHTIPVSRSSRALQDAHLGSRGHSIRLPREPLFIATGRRAMKRNHIFKKPNAQLGAPTPHEGCL